jgi:hypothetical protein
MSLAHALRASHLRYLLSSCLLQIKYACAMIATGTRHTILICACTNPEKVAGILQTFLSLLAHFKCETCAVTLGARTYRTSKRMQDKGYHIKRQQESEVILTSTSKCACCAPSEAGLPDTSRQATCLARASQPKKKRRKSKKAKGTVIAAPTEASTPPLVAVVAPRLVHPPQHRMHIDYAHSITLGRNKEFYYLIIVIDSIDFTWAQPSPNRSEPEDLIHDFMTLTGIKVGHIRLTERANSHAAQLFRRIAKGIILSSKRYQHTHIPSMLELKVTFAFVRTRYARFCGVRICPAGFGLMRYFIGVALMPTGPTPAVIQRGKSSTNWGLTPSVMNEKSAPQTILAQSRRRRVARSLGKGHV